MAKALDQRRDEVLRDWCEAATAKAVEASGRSDLGWKKSGDSIYRYHCPNPNGGHEWKGDDPAAWVSLGRDGAIKAGCRVCAPKGAELEDAYVETMKSLLGWEDEAGLALRPGKEYRVIREHLWRTWDDGHEVKTIKVRVKGDRTDKWWWRIREVDPDRQGFLAPAWRPLPKPSEWAEERWPALKGGINLALKLYRDEVFDGLDFYSVILCEGAKDADTVRDLLAAAPNASAIPTATQSPNLSMLAPHHEVRFRGRRVAILGDNDKGGEAFARNASGLVWSTASAVKMFPSSDLFGEGQDVTDWVEERRAKGVTTRELADELLAALSRTPDLTEPLAEPRGWRAKLRRGEKGSVSKTSVANGRIIWAEHPDLVGRVSTNSRSGEVEVGHPPWGGDRCVGARRAARSCAAWLEEHHEVALSVATLEDALLVDGAAPMRNPLAGFLVGEDWDGVPRLDGLFTHYLPLKADHEPAVRLARLFMGDLVAKLAGELAPQRVLVAIHTDEPIDVAGALLGRHGVRHRGRVEMRQVVQFAQQEAGVVQISTEPVVDKNMARGSIAHLFASHLALPHGWISSPLFVAVGSAGPSIDSAASSHVDERCLVLEPAGPVRVEALREDADQILAEAAARGSELAETAMVRRSEVRTVDDVEVDENLAFMLRLILDASTRQIDHPDEAVRHRLVPVARRPAPKEFIPREWFLDVFGPVLHGQWRDRASQAKMFNRACRRLGLTGPDGSVGIFLTKNQASYSSIEWPTIRTNKPQIYMPGVRLTEGRIEQVTDVLTSDPRILEPYKCQNEPANPLETKDISEIRGGPIVREKESLKASSDPISRAGAHIESTKRVGGENQKIKITDGAHVEAVREGGAWLILVEGIEVDPAALAAELRERPPWEDPTRLAATDAASLRRWLDEVGAEAEVEEVA